MDIINLPQIFWQAINFLILYWIIAKFVVPPTNKFLKKREEEIKQGLHNAQVAKKQIEDAEKMKDEVLQNAKVEGNKILEEVRMRAEQVASKVESDARENARLEADRIIAASREEVEGYKRKLENEAVKLAEVIAKKSVSEGFNLNLQHELLKKQMEELKKDNLNSVH